MNCTLGRAFAVVLVAVLVLGGCSGKNKKSVEDYQRRGKGGKTKNVCLPLEKAPADVAGVFDDDIEEFALVDEPQSASDVRCEKTGTAALATIGTTNEASKNESAGSENEDDANDFSWIDEEEDEGAPAMETVYFDFDKHVIKSDQEDAVQHDVVEAKKVITESRDAHKKPLLIVEGHSCSSAGSAAYNMALSEKRAKVLADRLVDAGVPREQVKVVGRGQECPTLVQGRPVVGDRQQQWPNRRDEINVVGA